MKRITPTVDVLSTKKKSSNVPYAAELTQTADRLVDDTVEAINSDKMGTIEAAGTISMATLLKSVAEGTIPLSKAFSLLKGFAERKTPDPIQRIEARHEIDMRAILVSAIAENPNALERLAAQAAAGRERVRQRIAATDDTLTLVSPAHDNLPNETANESVLIADGRATNPPTLSGLESFSITKSKWTPGNAPDEIEELSNEGQGSDLRNI